MRICEVAVDFENPEWQSLVPYQAGESADGFRKGFWNPKKIDIDSEDLTDDQFMALHDTYAGVHVKINETCDRYIFTVYSMDNPPPPFEDFEKSWIDENGARCTISGSHRPNYDDRAFINPDNLITEIPLSLKSFAQEWKDYLTMIDGMNNRLGFNLKERENAEVARGALHSHLSKLMSDKLDDKGLTNTSLRGFVEMIRDYHQAYKARQGAITLSAEPFLTPSNP